VYVRPEVVNLLPVESRCAARGAYVRPEVVNLLPVESRCAARGAYVRPEVGVYPPFDLLRWGDI